MTQHNSTVPNHCPYSNIDFDEPKFKVNQFVKVIMPQGLILFKIDEIEFDSILGYIYYGYAVSGAWGRGMAFENDLELA